MATVGAVTEAAFRARFDDQMSAGAAAAARAMGSLAGSVEVVEERVMRAERSARSWINQNDALTQASNKAATAQKAHAAAAKALEVELAAGGERTAAAQRALAALAEKAQQAELRVKALAAAQGSAGQSIGSYVPAAQQLARGVEQVGAANDNAGQSFRGLGNQIQNASYQIGDFAVQVASGQSVVTALAQQLPQLLGGFGVIGALSGAAVAIAAVVYNMVAAVEPTKALNEAIDRQDTLYEAATEASRRYREGLGEEAERVSELTGLYARYSEQRREVETRRLQDARDGLEQQQQALRGRVLDEASNLPTQLANAANIGRSANLLRAAQGQNVEGVPQQFTDAARAILEAKAAAEVTADMLATLAQRAEEAAGAGGGDLSDALRGLAARAREALPDADRLSTALERNATQSAALQAAAPGAADGIGVVGAAAGSATGAVAGLSGALTDAVRRLAQLRRDQLDNPFIDLERSVATLRNQASALARGDNDGSEAIERREQMRQRFEQEREKLLKQQEENMARAGASEADRQQARVEGERQILGLQREFARLTESNRAQEEANRKAEEAARKAAAEGRRAARAEDAAAARDRRADLEFERQLSLRTFTDRTDPRTGAPILNTADELTLREARRMFAPIQQERDKAQKEAETAYKAQERQAEQTYDRITDYAGNAIADLFLNTEGGWKRTMDNLVRIGVSTFAKIAAEAALRPIVMPIVQSVMGVVGTGAASAASTAATSTAASVAGIAGAAGQGGTGIMSMLGLGGIGDTVKGWMNTPLIGEASVGKLLGGAGLGFGAGTILNRLVGGKSTGGAVGSGLGGIAGAAAGALDFIPGGAILGGLLGGAGGGLLGGLFGANKGWSGGVGRIGVNEEGEFYRSSTAGKKYDMAQVEAETDALVSQINATLKQARVTLTGSATALVAEQGFGGAKQDAAADLLGNIRSRGQTGNMWGDQALQSSKGKTVEDVLDDAAFARDVFAPFVDGLSDVERAAEAQRKSYQETIDRAQALGFETTKVAEAMEKAAEATRAQREAVATEIRADQSARRDALRGTAPDLDALIQAANENGNRRILDIEARLTAAGFKPQEGQRFGEVDAELALLGEERQARIATYRAQEQATRDGFRGSLLQSQGRGYVADIEALAKASAEAWPALARVGVSAADSDELFRQQVTAALGQLDATQLRDVADTFANTDARVADFARSVLAATQATQRMATAGEFWNADRSAQGRGYLNDLIGVRQATDAADSARRDAGLGQADIDRLFAGQISGILGGLSDDQLRDVAGSMRGLDNAVADAAQRMLDAGRSAEALAAANDNASRRAQAQDNVASAVTGVADYLQQLRLGPDSSLSPTARVEETLANLQRVASEAANGNFAAFTQVTGAADLYRQAATDFGASPGRAGADREIAQLLGQLTSVNTDALTSSAMEEIMRQNATATSRPIVDAISDLRREFGALSLKLAGMAKAA